MQWLRASKKEEAEVASSFYKKHYMLLLYFVFFCHTVCHVASYLVPQPRVEPGPPALGVWSLSHWTTGEVPEIANLFTL